MSDPMDDEFDTVAEWTADAALELGPEHRIPAACRGSGGPGALTWLLDRLAIDAGDRLLDSGAGVGGPAAFAAAVADVRPVLAEPEPGACRAAVRLFGLTTVVASGARLPFVAASFDLVWSVAVLCTTDEQRRFLRELRRVVTGHGRVGLLVYVRTTDDLSGGPHGNDFPTDAELDAMIGEAGLDVTARGDTADEPRPDDGWTRHADAVADRVRLQHSHEQAWRTAQEQADAFAGLLKDGRVRGRLIAAKPR